MAKLAQSYLVARHMRKPKTDDTQRPPKRMQKKTVFLTDDSLLFGIFAVVEVVHFQYPMSLCYVAVVC